MRVERVRGAYIKPCIHSSNDKQERKKKKYNKDFSFSSLWSVPSSFVSNYFQQKQPCYLHYLRWGETMCSGLQLDRSPIRGGVALFLGLVIWICFFFFGESVSLFLCNLLGLPWAWCWASCSLFCSVKFLFFLDFSLNFFWALFFLLESSTHNFFLLFFLIWRCS